MFSVILFWGTLLENALAFLLFLFLYFFLLYMMVEECGGVRENSPHCSLSPVQEGWEEPDRSDFFQKVLVPSPDKNFFRRPFWAPWFFLFRIPLCVASGA